MINGMPSRRGLLKAGAAVAACIAGSQTISAHVFARTPLVRPLVFGHRGACAWRPEHTLASYAKAIADGADFVEPDLVSTRDGVLVARHENNIAETTDVAAHAEFADRHAVRMIDGQSIAGWFTEDFTLAELKTLRARERLGTFRPESQSYDDHFQIVTFDEIADFVAAEAAARGRVVGLIPELKHSTYFAGIGLPLEAQFVAALDTHRYLKTAPVIVQSFEVGNLRSLHSVLDGRPNIQLMQLTESTETPADRAAAGDRRKWGERLDDAGLAEIASYADWLSPFREDLLHAAGGKPAVSTGLVARAHRAGLRVSSWTFRPENRFLPSYLRDTRGEESRNPAGSIADIRRFIDEGIDGFFTDDPALGVEARARQADRRI